MTQLFPSVRPMQAEDRAWCDRQLPRVGGPVVISRGLTFDLREHPTLIAQVDGAPIGLLVYHEASDGFEILAILAVESGRGVGTALLEAAEAEAVRRGVGALVLCTTNDNLDALRFYQRRGFVVVDYWVGGFADVLRQKGVDPNGAPRGNFGIVIRDIIILRKSLVP